MSESPVRRNPGVRHWLAIGLIAAVIVTGAALWPVDVQYSGPTGDWPHYGNDLGGMRYSPVDQITPSS